MKICVCSFYDTNFACVGDITSKINKNYCDKYDLSFKVDMERVLPERHPAWECLPQSLKYLDNYDYVVSIDADACFRKDAPSIKEVISSYPEKDIIWSGDICDDYDKINTGFMIFKNTPYTKDYITDILKDNKLNRYYHKRNWEQSVIRSYYKKNHNDIQQQSVIVRDLQDFGVRNKIPKSYIIHMICKSNDKRIAFFSKQLSLY